MTNVLAAEKPVTPQSVLALHNRVCFEMKDKLMAQTNQTITAAATANGLIDPIIVTIPGKPEGSRLSLKAYLAVTKSLREDYEASEWTISVTDKAADGEETWSVIYRAQSTP